MKTLLLSITILAALFLGGCAGKETRQNGCTPAATVILFDRSDSAHAVNSAQFRAALLQDVADALPNNCHELRPFYITGATASSLPVCNALSTGTLFREPRIDNERSRQHAETQMQRRRERKHKAIVDTLLARLSDPSLGFTHQTDIFGCVALLRNQASVPGFPVRSAVIYSDGENTVGQYVRQFAEYDVAVEQGHTAAKNFLQQNGLGENPLRGIAVEIRLLRKAHSEIESGNHATHNDAFWSAFFSTAGAASVTVSVILIDR